MRRYAIAPGVLRLQADEERRREKKQANPYLAQPTIQVKRSPRPRPVVVGQQEMVF